MISHLRILDKLVFGVNNLADNGHNSHDLIYHGDISDRNSVSNIVKKIRLQLS